MSVVTITLAVATAAGCGGSSPAAPTPTTPVTVTDSIRGITNLLPATGTILQPGQTVTFSGTPAYSLATADSGTVHLIIQDQANRILQPIGTQPNTPVVKGNGEVTLSQTLTVPTEGVTSVVVFFALLPAGASLTNASTSVFYPVR
jgi:hypothetical protein